MKSFKSCHPLAGAVYYLYFIIFTVVYRHPAAVGIALVSAFSFAVITTGKRAVIFNLRFVLPVFLVTAVLNPLINHEGATVLVYFKNGNPLTLESVIYGLYSGTMLAAVMNIFLSLNEIMTDDKISYLIGNAAPYLALVFSLTLRFIPQFTGYVKEALSAQHTLGNNKKNSITGKIKMSATVISSSVTRSIEHSAETAQSMKSRGFATGKRTYFSLYRFTSKDIAALIFFSVCIVSISVLTANGALSFTYFPVISSSNRDWKELSALLLSFVLFIFPCFTDIKEEIRWKLSH